MRNILQSAGVPPSVLQKIPAIIDTCSICRRFAAPGHRTIPTSRTITRFNDLVQHDLIFAKKEIRTETTKEETAAHKGIKDSSGKDAQTALTISATAASSSDPHGSKASSPWQHILDCATRLSQAAIIKDKTEESLMNSVTKIWINPYGPPRILETDQESGLISYRTKTYLQAMGTTLVERPKNSHAQMVERHHAILRETFLKIKHQADSEGIAYTKEQLLALAVNAKNTLTTVGGYTPQQAVFGQQSALLPDMTMGIAASEDDDRSTYRLREIALQSMLQATSMERVRRASKSRTQLSTKASEQHVGQIVEFYRDPPHKEASGWRGPGEIVHIDHERGCVHVKWQNRVLICRPQDVRASLMSWLVTTQSSIGASDRSLEYIMEFTEGMTRGTIQLGFIRNPYGEWQTTSATKRHYEVFISLLETAACVFQLSGCVGARLHYQQPQIHTPDYLWGLVLYWLPGEPPEYITTSPKTTLYVEYLHAQWRSLHIVQFLHHLPDDEGPDKQHPDIPHLSRMTIPIDWKEMHPLPFQVPLRQLPKPKPKPKPTEPTPTTPVTRQPFPWQVSPKPNIAKPVPVSHKAPLPVPAKSKQAVRPPLPKRPLRHVPKTARQLFPEPQAKTSMTPFPHPISKSPASSSPTTIHSPFMPLPSTPEHAPPSPTYIPTPSYDLHECEQAEYELLDAGYLPHVDPEPYTPPVMSPDYVPASPHHNSSPSSTIPYDGELNFTPSSAHQLPVPPGFSPASTIPYNDFDNCHTTTLDWTPPPALDLPTHMNTVSPSPFSHLPDGVQTPIPDDGDPLLHTDEFPLPYDDNAEDILYDQCHLATHIIPTPPTSYHHHLQLPLCTYEPLSAQACSLFPSRTDTINAFSTTNFPDSEFVTAYDLAQTTTV